MKNICLYLLVLIVSGCQYQYLGDGDFIDYGYRSAVNRYELSIGVINLCKNHQYSYKIGHLPPDNFKLNLAYCDEILDGESYQHIVDLISSVVLEIAIISDDGQGVFNYTGPIWETGVTNDGVYYQKGMHPSFKPNNKCIDWVFMPDQIGYSMNPSLIKVFRVHKKREITMKIVNPVDPEKKSCEADLSLIGGGWK